MFSGCFLDLKFVNRSMGLSETLGTEQSFYKIWRSFIFLVLFPFILEAYRKTFRNNLLSLSTFVCTCSAVPNSLLPIAHQVPLSMEFSRQEYWGRLHFLL